MSIRALNPKATDGKKLLILICSAGRRGQELGRELMAHGHIVFLSDADRDIELCGSIVDAYIDVRTLDRGEAAVLCQLDQHAPPSRDALRPMAVLELPASCDALASFEAQLVALSEEGRKQPCPNPSASCLSTMSN